MASHDDQSSMRASYYPREPKTPHRRCGMCGRFLGWDTWEGTYRDHAMRDDYSGGWEWTCR